MSMLELHKRFGDSTPFADMHEESTSEQEGYGNKSSRLSSREACTFAGVTTDDNPFNRPSEEVATPDEEPTTIFAE